MTISVSKDGLMKAMKQCLPGIEKGSSLIEGADAFLFSKNFVHSYNGVVAVSVPMDLGGMECAIKAADFFKFISKTHSALISGVLEDNELKFEAGRAKAKFKTIESVINEHLDTLNLDKLEFKPVPENFDSALNLCKMSCNPTSFRGIYVHENNMMSTDSIRMNHFEMKEPMETFWVDDPAMAEFMKLGKAKSYAVGEAWIHFKMENETIFSAKVKDHSQFPGEAIKGHLEGLGEVVEGSVKGTMPKKLAEIVDRVATLASSTEGAAQMVRVTLDEKEVVLYAEKTSGSVEDGMEWDKEKPYETKETTQFWVEASFLLEAAKKSMEFTVVNRDGSVVILFTAPGYTQMASTIEKE